MQAPLCSARAAASANRGSAASSGSSGQFDQRRPEAIGLEHHQRDEAAVLRSVCVADRIVRGLVVASRHRIDVVTRRRGDVRCGAPDRSAEQADVDYLRFAGALTGEQRGGYATCGVETGLQVSESGAGHRRRVFSAASVLK